MREFTLDEARAALEVVRRPLAELQHVQYQLKDARAELQTLGRRHLNNGVVAERRMRDLHREQVALAEQVQRHTSAIKAAGAELKNIDDGLLDFPAHIEGVPAYWCWRTGEADIEWWHPRDTGFAGRRRIVTAG